MKIHFSAGKIKEVIEKKIKEEINRWHQENKVQKLWEKDATLWTHSDEDEWMGWLNETKTLCDLAKIESLIAQIKAEGFDDIVLLGMGGSSLFPAMMASIFGNKKDYPRLHILDSTDPIQIKNLEKNLHLKKTLFIISSKSGKTLETIILKDYFYQFLQTALNKKNVGNYFLAITDRESALDKIAIRNHFRDIFYGVPSIGGRYSALSNFGMVPSALIGTNIKAFLHHAEIMRQACRLTSPIEDNPGVFLGILLGVCEKLEKNKITFILSPCIQTFGAWLEQLLAESTGKCGRGFIPIDQEPLGNPDSYDMDRVFVYICLDTNPDLEQDRALNALKEAGFIIIKIHLQDTMYLGAEIFRWEIATAVASSIIDVHPFNQPDVEESKRLLLQLLNETMEAHHLYQPHLLLSQDGLALFTDKKTASELTKKLIGIRNPNIEHYLKVYLSLLKSGDYVQLAAFIEMSFDNMALLQKSRELIRNSKKIATALSFGPRFLHSSSQAYKGGVNTGAFLQITADYENDLPIPNRSYTFGKVIHAQALADFITLSKHSRQILRINLGKDVHEGLRKLYQKIKMALEK